MQLITTRNFMIALAAALVVGLGIMAISLSQRPAPKTTFESDIEELEMQSDSDDVDAIEQDLMQTDLSDVDQELQDIDRELDQTY